MRKLKKGDDVVIIAGKDKGKRGLILRVESPSQVVVQGVNSVKKHQKPNPAKGSIGGIIDREMPIHVSNVAIYNFASKQTDRVGFKIDINKNKTRIYKSTGEVIES
ncbi:50S ribosomal protein L24 [Nitrosomonas sp. Nm166]|uniref:50S ribosomal protein L24 n=1 Tax=Nitrosomonas sp. Nm166 TaxID=1881054 RepID=UPI0008E06413|nr:50S ribosomal protein L24 [Nitrosomonas sp. Nm166]SFE87554.1 large subunit ribosomal protein L24 [Nitrosomonas sp. Nm166]